MDSASLFSPSMALPWSLGVLKTGFLRWSCFVTCHTCVLALPFSYRPVACASMRGKTILETTVENKGQSTGGALGRLWLRPPGMIFCLVGACLAFIYFLDRVQRKIVTCSKSVVKITTNSRVFTSILWRN